MSKLFVAGSRKSVHVQGIMNKKWSVGARIDGDLHRRFCLSGARFGVSDTQMITDALEALCDYALERGRYERPMKMIFDEERASYLGMVADPPPDPPPKH